MKSRFSSVALVLFMLLILILAGSAYAAGPQSSNPNSLAVATNFLDTFVTGFAPLNPTPAAPVFSGYPSTMSALVTEQNIEFSFMVQNDDAVPHTILLVALDGASHPELMWTSTFPPGLTLNPGESAVLGYVSGNFLGGMGIGPRTGNLQVTAIPAGMESFPINFFVLSGLDPLMGTNIPIDFGTIPEGAGEQTLTVNIINTGPGDLVWNSDPAYIIGGDAINFDIAQVPATAEAQIVIAGGSAPVDFKFNELGMGAGGYSSSLNNQLVSVGGNSNDPIGAGISLDAVVAALPGLGENIGNPIVIPSLPYSDSGDTTTFVDDYDEVCPYTGSTSPDVVYEYTPLANQVIDIDLCDSGYDTKVYIYDGGHTPGAPYACNDDDSTYCTGPAFRSYLNNIALTAGNTYYIVVDGYGGDFGPYDLDIFEDSGSGDTEYPVQVDDDIADDLYPAVDLARDGSDNVYVVWQSIRDGTITTAAPFYPATFEADNWNIFFANSSNHGLNWTVVQVSSDASSDIFADIDVDTTGVIHVVWQSNRQDDYGRFDWHIYYSNSSDGGQTWSTPRFVGNESYISNDRTWDDLNPAIVADNVDDLHIVWQSSMNDTFNAPGSFNYTGLGMAYIMASWNWDIHYLRNSVRPQINSTPPEIVEFSWDNTDEFPDVEVDSGNTPYVVWHSAEVAPFGDISLMPPNFYDVYAKDSFSNSLTPGFLGGTWDPLAWSVSDNMDDMTDMYPANAVTSIGDVEAVWQKFADDPVIPLHIYSEPCPSPLGFHSSMWSIYHSNSSDGSTWKFPETMITFFGTDAFPDIAVDMNDTLFAKWQRDTSAGAGSPWWDILESNSTNGTIWWPPWNVSTFGGVDDCHPQVIVDNYSRNVWHSDMAGNWDVYYSEWLVNAPFDCNCSSCNECEVKLHSPSCDVVYLTQDLSELNTCITVQNVSDKVFDCQGYEIEFGGGTQLSPSAFHLIDNSTNVTIQNCSITNYWSGIIIASHNNTITNNRIYDNNAGISTEADTKDNLIYNNYFDNSGVSTINANDWGNNSWNTTYNCSIPGYRNIIGGNCTGGNFWDDYTGDDDGSGGAYPWNIPGDGIGDTDLPYNGSNSIYDGGDWLPLVPLAGPCLNISDVYLNGTDSGVANVYINEDTTLCSSGPFYNIPDPEQNGVLIINASNIFLDCANVTINGTDIGYGVYNYNFDNVTIRNCKIWNYRDGIHLDGAQNNTLFNNTLKFNAETGIALFFDTWFSKVLNNTAIQNDKTGIFLSEADGNLVFGNNASQNNHTGIRVHLDSFYNNVTNNLVSHNNIGILTDFESEHTNIINNSVWSNGEAGIRSVDAWFTNVINNTLSNNGEMEIHFDNANGQFTFPSGQADAMIANNTITNYNTAVRLQNSINVSVVNNWIEYPVGGGSVGVRYTGSTGIVTVNNYVSTAMGGGINAMDNDLSLSNAWNLTKTCVLGPNIIGGPCWGGNFWDDYNGTDTDADLLGDTNLPYDSNGSIVAGGDWHPLVYNESSCLNLSGGDNYINSNTIAAPNVLICGYNYQINDTGAPGVVIINTSNIDVRCWIGSGTPTTIQGNNTGYGVYNPGFDNVTVRNCEIFNYSGGVKWDGASDGGIQGNNLHDHNSTGIHVLNLGSGNTISNNIIKDTGFAGIQMDSFAFENIIENNYIDPSPYGIYMFQSYNNTIGPYNNISNNNVNVYMHNCFGNVFYRNYIQNAATMGFEFKSSSHNRMHDNYIAGNAINAWDDNTNEWNGTQSVGQNILEYLGQSTYGDRGGNYWDDYPGNDTDNDAIGDTFIPWNSSGYITCPTCPGDEGDWLPLTAKGPTPDLIVTSITYFAGPPYPYEMDPFNLTVTVNNNGTAAANNVTLQINVSGLVMIEDIGTVSGSSNVSHNFTFPINYGNFTVYSFVDPSDSIAEMDETNNEMNITNFGLFVKHCGDGICDPEEDFSAGGNHCPVDCIIPTINSVGGSPDPVNQAFIINISANVTDLTNNGTAPGAVGSVWFAMGGTPYPATGNFGDIWWWTGADTTVPGVNNYTVYANDTYGYDAVPMLGNFTVNIVPPVINWVNEIPDPVMRNNVINISANITDDNGIGAVRFIIDGGIPQLPNGSSGNIFWYIDADTSLVGLHTYSVMANDTFNNPAVPQNGTYMVVSPPPAGGGFAGGGAGPPSGFCEVRVEFNGERRIYVDPGVEETEQYEFLSLGCNVENVYLTVEGIDNSWFTITPSSVATIESGAIEMFTVKVLVPVGTQPGTYSGNYVVNAADGYTFHNPLSVIVQAPPEPEEEKPAEVPPPTPKPEEPIVVKVAKGLFGMSRWAALALGGILTIIIVAILAVAISGSVKRGKGPEPEAPASSPSPPPPAPAQKAEPETGGMAKYMDKEEGEPVLKDAAETEKED